MVRSASCSFGCAEVFIQEGLQIRAAHLQQDPDAGCGQVKAHQVLGGVVAAWWNSKATLLLFGLLVFFSGLFPAPALFSNLILFFFSLLDCCIFFLSYTSSNFTPKQTMCTPFKSEARR